MIPSEVSGSRLPGGLVGEQQGRLVHERTRKRHPLLLSTRQLVGIVVELRRQADHPQDLGNLRLDVGARLPDHLQAVRDVVVDGAVREQLEVLEHHADVPPQLGGLLARQRTDVATRDQHLAAGGLDLTQQEPDESALSAAGRAHQEGELAALDRHGGSVEADVAARIDNGRVAQLHGRSTAAAAPGSGWVENLVDCCHVQGSLAGNELKPRPSLFGGALSFPAANRIAP